MAAETTDKGTGAPLILGLLSVGVVIGILAMVLPDSNNDADSKLFQKTGTVQDTSKALQTAPKGIPGTNLDTDKNTPLAPEVLKRFEIVKALKTRFSESDLKLMARASLRIEKRVLEDFGESEAAYQEMDSQWAVFCKEKKITEEERDALEDEALRRGWIQPLTGDD